MQHKATNKSGDQNTTIVSDQTFGLNLNHGQSLAAQGKGSFHFLRLHHWICHPLHHIPVFLKHPETSGFLAKKGAMVNFRINSWSILVHNPLKLPFKNILGVGQYKYYIIC